MSGRTDLAVRTQELYQWLLDRHILPTLGKTEIGELTPSSVRAWHASLARTTAPTASKAYRLLSSILRTAVADEILARNRCQVKGASGEKAAERPVSSVAEVQALADAMPERLRIAVLLAAWCQLRRAELLGLRRRDVDMLRAKMTISNTRTVAMSGAVVEKAPKTEAGRRTVAIPSNIVPVMKRHLDSFVDADPNALVINATSRTLDHWWGKARVELGMPQIRFHDLQHSGLTWSAATGAAVAELMHRAGHASPAAALRYQHATEDRDRALADALAHLSAPAKVTVLSSRDGRAKAGSKRKEI
jgi:integrase